MLFVIELEGITYFVTSFYSTTKAGGFKWKMKSLITWSWEYGGVGGALAEAGVHNH